MIIYKTRDQIAKMRESGRVVARTLRLVSQAIEPGVSTLQLNDMAEKLIREAGGIPSFLGYRGYPAATCIAVNDVVVHGIPNDTPLRSGDIVTLDFGVILDDWHADGAWTYACGEIDAKQQRLMNVTRESLYQGIAKARVGATLGDVASAVQKYVESHGYSVVRELVGHGVGTRVHEEPNVPNFGKPGKLERIKEGLSICIEPMVNAGRPHVDTLDDGWTVVTRDGSLSAHYEHTVAITRDGAEILTQE